MKENLDIFEDNKAKEKEVLEKINSAIEFRKQQRDNEYIVNMAHYEGLQWNLAENKDESPFMLKSDINHLKNAVDLRLGSLYSESYYGDLQPLSPNDIESVNILNNLYRNEWDRLNADDRVEEAIKAGCIQDNGYTEVSFDTGAISGGTGTRNEGSIVLETLSTTDVYLDPNAKSIDDCEYMVVNSEKSDRWIKRHKPEWMSKIKAKDIKPEGAFGTDEKNIYVGRNYDVSKKNLFTIRTMYEKYTKDIDIPVEDINGPIMDIETGEPLVDTVQTTAIRIYYVVNDKLIEVNEDYPFDDYPIIPFQWEPEPQSPYGIPLLRGLTVPQKVANLIESAANNIAMHYSTPTWLVSDQSGLDINKVAKLANAVGMVWKVSGSVNDAIKQMDVPELNENLIGIRNSFVENIQSYSGVTSVYIGNVGTAGSTAEGTNSAINRATIIDNSPIKQIEKYVEKLSRMIIKFMTRYYKNQKIYIRDTQRQSGEYTFKDFLMKDDYEYINYDFNVKLAGRSKSDKNRQYNLLKDLYTTQNQYKEEHKIINIPDLVKAAQLDNYDEMFKRFNNMTEEAFAEKANLIVQIMQIGQTITPNGQPLVTAEEMQQGILDVLDDNGDLSVVEQMFNTYEEYQTQLAELQNAVAQQERQSQIDTVNQENANLENMLLQNSQRMINDAQNGQVINE